MNKLFDMRSNSIKNEQDNLSSQNTKKLLCISHVFPPKINPLTNRVKKLLEQFQYHWQVVALTSTENGFLNQETNVQIVRDIYPVKLINLLHKFKLSKFINFFIWPDKAIFWILPAILKGYQLIKEHKPDVIFVFMMPYSSSLVGIVLKWLTGIPLVLSLDDSISCTDMHPTASDWLHHHLELYLEKFYVQQANKIIYVSQFNLELAKNNQHPSQHSKFHLIRCGADILDFSSPVEESTSRETFEIVYTGGMNGWYWFNDSTEKLSLIKRIYRTWMNLGRYERANIDYRTSSPVFVGQAIQQLITQDPNLKDKIHLKIYGNRCENSIVQEVLRSQGLSNIVSVFDPLPHSEVVKLSNQADLLFITLPDRPDGSEGGRISCKTYEYLTTDRPILAAVPKGENWNYLLDKLGTWLVEPTDIESMSKVLDFVISAKFSGSPLRYDRTNLQKELSYEYLAQDYLRIFDQLCKKIPD